MEKKHKYYTLNKPFGYLSQFKDEDGNLGLGNLLHLASDVYAVGRLDKDSEGLLILTNDKSLNDRLLNPKYSHIRTYLMQVEGTALVEQIAMLENGVEINVDGKLYKTSPANVKLLQSEPDYLWERLPPIRERKSVPTSWLEIQLTEGKNRQVRKMTAKVALPTLRLIRIKIENLELQDLKSGECREIEKKELYSKLKIKI